jgi:hypothetical protein
VIGYGRPTVGLDGIEDLVEEILPELYRFGNWQLVENREALA